MNKSKRILVIDDEANVVFILSAILRTLSDVIEVAIANSGYDALRQIREGSFDLVITDINMPDIDGIELTKEVRLLRPDMQIVWITGYGSSRVRAEGDRLGVYKCLEKPVRISELRMVALDALDA